jgi:ATP-dependent DNA ligase
MMLYHFSSWAPLLCWSEEIQFSEEFTVDAAAFFQACADHQLEGIVSKLASSKYRSGRSKTWLKTKCFTESAFLIIGTDRDQHTGASAVNRLLR